MALHDKITSNIRKYNKYYKVKGWYIRRYQYMQTPQYNPPCTQIFIMWHDHVMMMSINKTPGVKFQDVLRRRRYKMKISYDGSLFNGSGGKVKIGLG